MKLHIKKLYKETVKQFEKHQVEIATALAVAALASVTAEPVDEEELAAKADIELMCAELLEVIGNQISAINAKLEGEDDATS